MWVLEARYKAEKIWYPVVWEKTKDSSDVIDYDINEELTVDRSSVFNANNDTTTGMATVIPWINAPKLIADTSIYWIKWWSWWEISVAVNYFYDGSSTYDFTSWITINTLWDWWIRVSWWNINISKTWTYLMMMTVSDWFNNNNITKSVFVKQNGTTIITSTSPLSQSGSVTNIITLNWWDVLTISAKVNTTSQAQMNWTINITLIKL